MVIIKNKFYGVGVIKCSLLSGLFGIIGGFIFGLLLFVFIEAAIDTWGVVEIPRAGLFFLSFLIVPIGFFILFFLCSLIFFLLLNLFLKILNGVDFYFREECKGNKYPPSRSLEDPYLLPPYSANN
jgi:uncharacterized BrkB/YihY/UPF0761 family membrane protein